MTHPTTTANVTGRWLPIAQADRTITHVQDFTGLTLRHSDRYWVRDEDGRTYEASWSEGKNGRDYWWDWEGESPVDPVEFMPHPLDPRWIATSVFPQPSRKDGGEPCAECHIQPGETCDICGAVNPLASTTVNVQTKEKSDINELAGEASAYTSEVHRAAAQAVSRARLDKSHQTTPSELCVVPAVTGGPANPSFQAHVRWNDPATAPKDGTMLHLLIQPGQEELDAFTSFHDSREPYETIGFNQLSHTMVDEWQFAGWDWCHDCITDGHGEVIGWLPFGVETTPAPAPDVAAPADLEEMILTAKDAYLWMREWSGSAFVAGETLPPGTMTEDECKAELYSGLCRLGNHMDWLADKLTALRDTAPATSATVRAADYSKPGDSYNSASYLVGSDNQAPAPHVTGWQDISTAPKDKTPVIIAVPTKDRDDWIIGEAYYDPENYDGGDWWWAGTGHTDYHSGPISDINHHAPEFWQPLPAPPALATTEGSDHAG